MRREADAMRACGRAGLRVPDVLADDDGDAPRHDRARDATGARARRSPAGSSATTSSPPRGRCSWASSPASSPASMRSTRTRCPASKLPDPVEPIWDEVPRARRSQPDLRPDPRVAGRPPPAALRRHADPRRPPDGQRDRRSERPRGGDRLGARPSWRSARGSRLALPEGMAFRRAARGRRTRVRSTSSSPPTRRRAAARSIATRCTGGWSRRRSPGASGACSRPTST